VTEKEKKGKKSIGMVSFIEEGHRDTPAGGRLLHRGGGRQNRDFRNWGGGGSLSSVVRAGGGGRGGARTGG